MSSVKKFYKSFEVCLSICAIPNSNLSLSVLIPRRQRQVISRGKLLPRCHLRVARGLSRSSFRSPEASREVVRESREASGDRHLCRRRPPATRLRVARGSGDRHLDRQRPLATSFVSRERLLHNYTV